MKKIISLILVLCVNGLFLLQAQDIDPNIAGHIECAKIEKAEMDRSDPVTCTYFSHVEPSFSCPEGMTAVCYGCYCTFASGAHIRTEACECKNN